MSESAITKQDKAAIVRMFVSFPEETQKAFAAGVAFGKIQTPSDTQPARKDQ